LKIRTQRRALGEQFELYQLRLKEEEERKQEIMRKQKAEEEKEIRNSMRSIKQNKRQEIRQKEKKKRRRRETEERESNSLAQRERCSDGRLTLKNCRRTSGSTSTSSAHSSTARGEKGSCDGGCRHMNNNQHVLS